MKTKTGILAAGLAALLAFEAQAADEKSPGVDHAKSPASESADARTTTPELSADLTREEANREHIRPARASFKVDTPPPAPQQEKKPAQPAQGLVWVPGHWAPVKGEWRWTAGEWGFPATPVSVWIEPKYDEKTKQWTAGYWQPDRAEAYQPETHREEPAPSSEKFF